MLILHSIPGYSVQSDFPYFVSPDMCIIPHFRAPADPEACRQMTEKIEKNPPWAFLVFLAIGGGEVTNEKHRYEIKTCRAWLVRVLKANSKRNFSSILDAYSHLYKRVSLVGLSVFSAFIAREYLMAVNLGTACVAVNPKVKGGLIL